MAFRFKQFSIEDDKSSMKVGTDAVLLGSWASADEAANMLEVGTGSGIIALMMAQRFPGLKIDGIDIDPSSAAQAAQNVLNSPWKDRIQIHNMSFRDFYKNMGQQYDLLISNPPFFENSLKPKLKNRMLSKHTDSLSHHELLYGAGKLSKRLLVIIPYLSAKKFRQLASLENFRVKTELEIYPATDKKPHRTILDMVKGIPPQKQEQKLFIRNEEGSFTEAYQKLTADFYLDF